MLDGRLLLAGIFIALGGVESWSEGKQVLADDEAAQMLIELHRENRDLRDQVGRLSEQVEGLQRQLADSRSQLDVEKIDGGKAGQVTGKTVSSMTFNDITRLRVMDVNREMKVAVISGGLRAGMKVGMKFSVMRDEQVVAQVRIVEVRENFAGGLIEKVEKDQFPENGDRLVLSSIED